MSLHEYQFVTRSIERIKAAQSENDLVKADDEIQSDPEYLRIPSEAVKQIEEARRDKILHLLGADW